MNTATMTTKPAFYGTALLQKNSLMEQLAKSVEETTAVINQRDQLESQLEKVKSELKTAVSSKDTEHAAMLRDLREVIKETLTPIKAEIQGYKTLSSLTVEQIVNLDTYLETIDGIDNEYKEETLGTAVQVGEYATDSAEWHQARAEGIGGSDVSIIMGVSPFKKREALLKMKTGEIVQKASNTGGAALRGHIWEQHIAREFATNHPDKKVVYTKASWANKDNSFQKANFDGLIYENDSATPNAILEIKTSSKPADWANGVPEHYRLQVIWYMIVTGIRKGYVAVRINDSEYREFEVTTTESEIAGILASVNAFVAEVKALKKALTT